MFSSLEIYHLRCFLVLPVPEKRVCCTPSSCGKNELQERLLAWTKGLGAQHPVFQNGPSAGNGRFWEGCGRAGRCAGWGWGPGPGFVLICALVTGKLQRWMWCWPAGLTILGYAGLRPHRGHIYRWLLVMKAACSNMVSTALKTCNER